MLLTNLLGIINNKLYNTKLKFLSKYLTKINKIINKKAINKKILKKGSPYYINKSGLTILSI